MKGKIIAIANHKGGVAKTTTTALLGLALSKKKKKVLLIDLDAQANLSNFFSVDVAGRVNIYDILVKGEKAEVTEINKNLFLIPSTLLLARAEIDLVNKISKEGILLRAIKDLQKDYDYIFIDCPPALNILTTNALAAATETYIPLTAEAIPLQGLAMLEDIIKEIKEYVNKDLEIGGVIITRYNNRKLNKLVIDTIQDKYKDLLFKTYIRENIAVAECPLFGGDIFQYSPDSNGAIDYMSLAKEVINRDKNQ